VEPLRLRLWLVAVCLAMGCVKYEAAPITGERVEKDLNPGGADELKIATKEIRHPLLKPLAVDLRDGLSAEEAGVLAVVANPSLRAERDRRAVAGAQLVQAGLLPNPQLLTEVGFPYDSQPPDVFTAYGVGVNWEVTSLIGRDEKKKGAQANADSVALDVAWKEWQVAQAARLAVYQVVSARMQLGLAKELEEGLREARDLMRQATEEHLKTSVDLSAAEAAWLEAHANVLDLERAEVDRRLALNKALGLPAGAQVKLKEDLKLPATMTVPGEEELVKSVEQRRLDLMALKKGYESQDSAFRVAVLGQFPKINLGYTEARDTMKVKTHGIGMTIDLPIFDRNHAAIDEEKATRQKLYDEYVERVFEARSDVATALADIEAVNQEIKANEAALPAMERLEADYRTAMNERNVDVVSYYAVRNNLTQKRIDAIKLRQELAELRSALELASGVYLDGMEGSTR